MPLRPVLGAKDFAALVRAHRALVVVAWHSGRPRGVAFHDAFARVAARPRPYALAALDVAANPAVAEELGVGLEPQLLFFRGGALVMRELVPRVPAEALPALLRAAEPAWRGYFGRAPCWPLTAP